MSAVPEVSRWSTAAVIARHEARGLMRGLAVYIAVSLALVAAAWLLLIDVRALEASDILVRADPFRAPVVAALMVLAVFLAVSAAVTAARDRESGTLEVLFYGPVDELSYVAGKVCGLVIGYIAAVLLLLASLLLLAWLSGFALTQAVLAGLALSAIPAAEIASFGILLSVGIGRVRRAVLLLVGVVVVLLGVDIAYRIILLVPIESPASPILPVRDALAALAVAVRWIGPFGYQERIFESLISGASRTALITVASALAYTAAMMAMAALWLRRRGVLRVDV